MLLSIRHISMQKRGTFIATCNISFNRNIIIYTLRFPCYLPSECSRRDVIDASSVTFTSPRHSRQSNTDSHLNKKNKRDPHAKEEQSETVPLYSMASLNYLNEFCGVYFNIISIKTVRSLRSRRKMLSIQGGYFFFLLPRENNYYINKIRD